MFLKSALALTCVAAAALMMGCAPQATAVPTANLYAQQYAGPPVLQRGWSRVYISAGTAAGEKLASARQIEPVFINGKRVGQVAKDEYFVVDIQPGTYEAYCAPEASEKTQVHKQQVTFKPDELRYFSCDIEEAPGSKAGWVDSLLAKAASRSSRSYLAEYPSNQVGSRLTDYRKLE